MLAGMVRELKSHHFSYSIYIQKWSLESQDQETGQCSGKGEGEGDCVVLREVVLSPAGHGNPAGTKQNTVPALPGQLPATVSHRPTPSILQPRALVENLKYILKIDGSFI